MTLKFGTDGVRGRAFVDLDPEWVSLLACSAAQVLQSDTVVIGTDGRDSGPAFVKALQKGFESQGLSVWFVGTVPTPAIAHIAATNRIAGAMVSASHNLSQDNGIKLLSAGGKKLSDTDQKKIEMILESEEFHLVTKTENDLEPTHSHLIQEWITSLQESIGGRDLEGTSVVIDCANGAVSHYAADALRGLGASVQSIHDSPDGLNINLHCGSTDTRSLQLAVKEHKADLGLAFDGDADRVLAIDPSGRIIDGDFMIAIFAHDMQERRSLKDNTVVVTVMANMGFHKAMENIGVRVHQTPVGDRQVLAALEENDWSLGGEQSGHIIFNDFATTGDGLLTGIQLLDTMKRSRKGLEEIANSVMVRYPQVLKQVDLPNFSVAITGSLLREIKKEEKELGEEGRILVRISGTEPILRIMVESTTQKKAENTANRLISAAETYFASFQ